VFVPIFKTQEQLDAIMARVNPICDALKAKGIRLKVDSSEKSTPGFKFADYELKGVPVRLAMGGRDLENGTIEVARRDTLSKETISLEGIEDVIVKLLEEIQANCYKKALDYRLAKTRICDSYEEFKTEIQKGGFLLCHWDGTQETEEKIKAETKATIRCIPLDDMPGFPKEPGRCMVTGRPSARRVVFALSY
jgi:prolyl-tRNA synthetase